MSQTLTKEQQEALDYTIGRATNENLERAVGVHFKNEYEEDDGGAAGPVYLLIPKGDGGLNRSRNEYVAVRAGDEAEWFTERYAKLLAEALDVPFWTI